MIHVVISKKDAVGPAGKTRIIGLEKSDLEVLAKDGIIEFDLVSSKFAIMFVKTSREEFLAELDKLKGELEMPAKEPAPVSAPVTAPVIEDASGQHSSDN